MKSFLQTLGLRSFATLKDVQLRLKSVKNIEKITKSMKMIASTKLARAQKAMEVGKTFANTTTHFFSQVATKHVEEEEEVVVVEEQDTDKGSQLVVVCSSDRGLCGAIHSSLTKEFKKRFILTHNEPPSNNQLKIVALGDKVKNQLVREFRPNLSISIGQISKSTPTFLEASTIVDLINKRVPLESISKSFILFNKFISAISYQSIGIPIFSLKDIVKSENLKLYEYSEEQFDNLCEYMIASSVFGAMIEGHASEMAARRSSMDNATKNAGEIINKLTMQYNRTRQAAITNELVDIITGAAAL